MVNMNNITKNTSSIIKSLNKKNYPTNVKNIIKTPTVNTTFYKKIDIKLVIVLISVLIIISLSIYLIVCFVHFNNTVCYEKKTFLNYFFDFSNNEVCIREKAPLPEPPKELPPPKKPITIFPEKDKKEVFHIANQDYTYDQAKCKCESYNARLATKNDIIDAYNNGANWCSYGWSDKQSAYYPVQKCDWDKMMADNERLPKKDKKYCGMPGVNGGFFANPTLKFGVNCYGIKPKGKVINPKTPFCPPINFCKLENNFEASHKLETDEVASFNHEKWNQN